MSLDRKLLLSRFFYCIILDFRETAIIREEGETPNDRNDRGAIILLSHAEILLNEREKAYERPRHGIIHILPLTDLQFAGELLQSYQPWF